jgi:TRAP-type C4-dicarboxylate transport system substrate-binding protein
MTTRRTALKASGAALLSAAAGPFVTGIARAQSTKLRMQTFLGPGTTVTTGFEQFAADVKSRTAGAVDIVTLPLGAVVPANDTVEAIKMGTLDGHYSSPPYFAGKDPGFAVLGDTLSCYPDPVTRDKWFTEGGGLALARQLYAQYGLFYVGPVYWTPEWMPMRKQINRLDDFKGMKLRMPEGLAGDLMKRVGASIVTLPFPEVANALQTGVLDGADMAGMAINLGTGIHTTAKYAVFARHSMPTTEVSVSEARWKSISPDNQKKFIDALADFSEKQRKVFTDDEKAALEKAKQMGITMTELPHEDQVRFRALAITVFEDWGKKNAITAKIVESHKAFMKKNNLI